MELSGTFSSKTPPMSARLINRVSHPGEGVINLDQSLSLEEGSADQDHDGVQDALSKQGLEAGGRITWPNV